MHAGRKEETGTALQQRRGFCWVQPSVRPKSPAQTPQCQAIDPFGKPKKKAQNDSGFFLPVYSIRGVKMQIGRNENAKKKFQKENMQVTRGKGGPGQTKAVQNGSKTFSPRLRRRFKPLFPMHKMQAFLPSKAEKMQTKCNLQGEKALSEIMQKK